MDIGKKSLAQLTAEHAEKKYLSIEVASKVSGYTKEYVERLCRLRKVEYRLWNNDQFVVELESLLSATHTLLVSYEGITFVNKDETRDDPSIAYGLMPKPASVAEEPAVARTPSPFMIVGKPVRSRGGKIVGPDQAVAEENETVPAVLHKDELFMHPVIMPAIVPPREVKQSTQKAFHLNVTGDGEADRIQNPITQGTHLGTQTHLKIVSEDEPAGIVPQPVTTLRANIVPPVISEQTEMPGPVVPAGITPKIEVYSPATVPQITTPEPLVSEKEIDRTNAIITPELPKEVAMIKPETTNLAPVASPYLPAIPEAHFLIPLEAHPLMKSVGFNAVVIALFLAIGYLSLGTFHADTTKLGQEQVPAQSMTAAVGGLFSDQVIVKDVGNDTVIVQPVFKDEVGKKYQYTVIPEGSSKEITPKPIHKTNFPSNP